MDSGTVTLLVDPHASALDVEAAANTLLLGSGDTRAPLLLGGSRPVVTAGRDRFNVVPLVKSAGPGVIAVGAAALVATLIASPNAFWRDVVTPTTHSTSAPNAAGPSAAPRLTTDTTVQTAREALPDDQVAGLVIDAALPSAEVAAPVPDPSSAAAPDPAPTRRLVLLLPQLPDAPAPAPTASAAKAKVEVAPAPTPPPSAPTVPVSVPTELPAQPAATPPARLDDAKPALKGRDKDRSAKPRKDREREARHGGRHGDDDDEGHGSREWGQRKRADRARPGAEHGLKLAERARAKHRDD